MKTITVISTTEVEIDDSSYATHPTDAEAARNISNRILRAFMYPVGMRVKKVSSVATGLQVRENTTPQVTAALVVGGLAIAGVIAYLAWPKKAAAASGPVPTKGQPAPAPAPSPPPAQATWMPVNPPAITPGNTYRLSWNSGDQSGTSGLTIPGNAIGQLDINTLMGFIQSSIVLVDPTAIFTNFDYYYPGQVPADWPASDPDPAGGMPRQRVQFGYGGTYSLGIGAMLPTDAKLFVQH